jgi:hypothetical protein
MASAGFDPNHFAATLNRIKQAALYVDRIDHNFLGPGQTFRQQEGETVLNMARRQVGDAIQHMATQICASSSSDSSLRTILWLFTAT